MRPLVAYSQPQLGDYTSEKKTENLLSTHHHSNAVQRHTAPPMDKETGLGCSKYGWLICPFCLGCYQICYLESGANQTSKSVGTRETPTLSQTDLKQTGLPGSRRGKYTISARSRRLNSTGERQRLKKRGGLRCVSEREPLHESGLPELPESKHVRWLHFRFYRKSSKTFFAHDNAEKN